MEIVHLSGYTQDEKISISKEYLIPKQLRANYIQTNDIGFTNDGLEEIINGHTREPGVRQLEREISSICRQSKSLLFIFLNCFLNVY